MDSILRMKEGAIRQKASVTRRPTAAFNPDPKWPQAFFVVLSEAGVPERQHSFHAHWVPFPASLKEPLRAQLDSVHWIHYETKTV
jgi:hypothetical protein